MTRNLVALAALLVLVGCGSTSPAQPPPAGLLAAHAKAAVLKVDDTATIRSACDHKSPTWECYWRSFEDDGDSALSVNLRLPTAMTERSKEQLVAESGFSFFSIYGELLPKLQSLVFHDLGTHLQIGLPVRRTDSSVTVP